MVRSVNMNLVSVAAVSSEALQTKDSTTFLGSTPGPGQGKL